MQLICFLLLIYITTLTNACIDVWNAKQSTLPCVSICLLLQCFLLMAKAHDASRTVAEWVLWAHNEGHVDLIEWCEKDGPSQLYCNLCAKKVQACSKSIKSHCLGYYTGTKDARTFHESAHAQKVWLVP